MNVGVYPADQGGCGHYRLIWVAEALRAQGHDITTEYGSTPWTITWESSGHAWRDGHPPIGERIVAIEHPGYDVVVLQRPLRWVIQAIIPHLQAQGVRVVVEVDDDFSCIPSRNAAWRDCHPLYSPDRNGRWLADACRIADLVTVSTPALARRYGGHGRVRVLHNCVPARYLDVHPIFGIHDFAVGWSGTVANHPGDLEVTRGGVARALGDAQFAVVGDGRHVQRALDLPEPPTASGWLDLGEYPAAVAQLDVGIVPLADHEFNRAKSWLKGLEMAALGVPFVASPTDEYLHLETEGAGMIAAKPRQWEGMIRALVQNPDLRDDKAALGRQAAARWTVEGNAWRWAEAWADTLAQEAAA